MFRSSGRRTVSLWMLAALTVLLLPASGPGPTPPPLDKALATVDSLRTHHQFRPALRRLDSLVQVYPNAVAVHWRRALLSGDLGKTVTEEKRKVLLYEQALRAANSALQIDSTSAWAHFVKAFAEGRLTLYVGTSERVKRSRRVKKHADRAVALDSTLAPAYHLRGRWHRDVADLNFLQKTLVKAFYGGLPSASFDQAIRNFKRAIELESKPYNHLELAKTYLTLGRTDAARKQLRKTLEVSGSPFDPEYKRDARSLLKELN